jgi:hypothetical protein
MSISSVDAVDATIHPPPDIFSLNGDMLRDHRENFLAQNGEQIGFAAHRPFVGQEFHGFLVYETAAGSEEHAVA